MMRRLALACVLAVIAAPAQAADSLGRLFFTPTQRASLDVARSQKTRVTVATEKTDEEAAPAPEVLTYGGMVRRSDGKTTVWINNRALHDREPVGGTSIINQVQPDGGISLQMPQSNRSVDLKVGQSVELLSGSIEDNYTRRATAPKPEPKPAAKTAAGAAPAERKTDDAQARARRGRQDLEETESTAPPRAAKPAAAPVESGSGR